MSDMSLTFRVQAEMAQAKAELASGVQALQKFGTAAKQAMREGSIGNTALTNSFEVLRASIDPTFAAQQKFAAIQQEVAGMVERGEASQMAANIVLEQAAAKYMGAETAAERYKAAQVEATAATQAAAREAADLQARFTGLRSSIDPAYAASLRFADAQMITQRAVAAGIATEAEAAAVLDGLRTKMDLAAGAAGRFETAQMAAGRSAQANAMVTGNVAAQFNDIGVMLASGQNPFMLAIQQGTQLSQVLNQVGGGAKGAVAALKAGFVSLLSPTTLLTMAVIAGGAALVQWATSADVAEEKSAELKKRIDELATAIREADTAQDAALEPLDKLRAKYLDLAGSVREARKQIAELALTEATSSLSDLVTETVSTATVPLDDLLGLGTVEQRMAQIRAKMEAARAAAEGQGVFYDDTADQAALSRLEIGAQSATAYVAEIQHQYGLTTDQARAMAVMLERVKAAAPGQEQAVRARELQVYLEGVYGGWQKAESATGGMYMSLAHIVTASADLAAITGQITGQFQEGEGAIEAITLRLDEALGFAEALASADIAGNISRALGPAAALAARLWNAASAIAAATSMGEQQPPLRGPAGMGDGDSAFGSMRERRLAEEKAKAEAWREAWDNGGGVSGGDAGGGSAGTSGDGLADLSAKAQAIMADLDLAIAAINEKVKAGLMSTAEAADAVNSAKAQAGDSVAELIAQIDRLGPAGAAAAEELRRQLPQLAADLNKDIGDLSKTLSEGFASPFKDFIKGSIDAGTAFEKFGDAVIDKLLDMAAQQFELSVLQPLFDSIFSGFSFGAIPGHAGGGEVQGKGTGTSDSNLRRLSHGEFVINAIATARNRDTLRAINAGAVVDAPQGPNAATPQPYWPAQLIAAFASDAAPPSPELPGRAAGSAAPVVNIAAPELPGRSAGPDSAAPVINIAAPPSPEQPGRAAGSAAPVVNIAAPPSPELPGRAAGSAAPVVNIAAPELPGRSAAPVVNIAAPELPGRSAGPDSAAPVINIAAPPSPVVNIAAPPSPELPGRELPGRAAGSAAPVPRWPWLPTPRANIPQEILKEAQQRMADPDRVLRSIMAGIPDPARMMPALAPAAAQPAPQPGRTILNIFNNAAPEVKVSQSERSQGPDGIVDVVIDRIEAGLAGNMSRGVGPLHDVFTGRFGLTRRGD